MERWPPRRRALVVSGGVACNGSVRAALQDVADDSCLRLVVPPPALCTDNGAMIAWAGQEVRGLSWSGRRTARFPFTPLNQQRPPLGNGNILTVQRLDAHFA